MTATTPPPWSTTPISRHQGSSTSPSGTPSAWPRPGPSPPSEARATPTTTRWPGGTSRLRGRRSTPSSKPTQAPRRDWARPTRRVRDHPPQHHPPRATCSAGVRTLHQTRYLTDGASVLAQELGQASRCPQTGLCATEGRMGHLTASARIVGPATLLRADLAHRHPGQADVALIRITTEWARVHSAFADRRQQRPASWTPSGLPFQPRWSAVRTSNAGPVGPRG